MIRPEIIIDGQWLSTLMPWGDLTWSSCWPGGTESIEFGVARSHRLFRPDALVQLDIGGQRIEAGLLTEPTRGAPLRAEGLWRKAEDEPALDAVGDLADNVNNAIDAAIARGLQWSGRIGDFSPVPGVDGNPTLPGDALHSLRTFVDAAMVERSLEWGVNGDGYAYYAAWGSSTLHMLPGVDGLAISRDGYASELTGRFLNSFDSVFYTISREDEAARLRWGRVPKTISEPLGQGASMDTSTAFEILGGLLEAGRSQIGWAAPLEVGHGDVVTEYGQPIDPATIKAGQAIRLHGLAEDVGDLSGQSWVDMRIAKVSHAVDGTATIEPVALSQPMNDVLAGLSA